MRKLIMADLRRILKKPVFLAAFLLMTLVEIIMLFRNLGKGYNDDYAFFVAATTLINFGTLVFSLSALIEVYSDEFRSQVYIAAIGRGLSRTKFVIAKFIDCMVLLAVQYAASGVAVVICGAVTGHVLRGQLLAIYLFTMVSQGSSALITMALASVFAFMTLKMPTTLAAFIVFSFIGQLIGGIGDIVVLRVFFDRYYYFALNESALSDFMLGSCSHGIIMTIVTFMVYCGISLGFSSLIFRKKELSL